MKKQDILRQYTTPTGAPAFVPGPHRFTPAVAPSLTGYVTAETGSSLYSTYLIVAAYIPSGLFLLIIVKVADLNDNTS